MRLPRQRVQSIYSILLNKPTSPNQVIILDLTGKIQIQFGRKLAVKPFNSVQIQPNQFQFVSVCINKYSDPSQSVSTLPSPFLSLTDLP